MNNTKHVNLKMPACNGRFYESGGVCPQKLLCEFAGFAPARTFVSPRLHKAASTLGASGRQRSGQRPEKLKVSSN